MKNIKPELHVKTHFKAIQSILMKDSKNLNLSDGSANEIMKQVITARNEQMAKHSEASKQYSLNQESNSVDNDLTPMARKKPIDATAIDYSQFDPIIKSVLRASNVYRYKGAVHLKDEAQLNHAIEEMQSDQNLFKK